MRDLRPAVVGGTLDPRGGHGVLERRHRPELRPRLRSRRLAEDRLASGPSARRERAGAHSDAGKLTAALDKHLPELREVTCNALQHGASGHPLDHSVVDRFGSEVTFG